MSEELWRRGAGELAQLIANGEVSSREVVDAHLERIEAVNGHLNAIVVAMADEARTAGNAAGLPVGVQVMGGRFQELASSRRSASRRRSTPCWRARRRIGARTLARVRPL